MATTTEELFVVLPDNITDLVRFTEQSGFITTEWARGYALYRYLFDRRAGATHQEAIDILTGLDYTALKKEADWVAYCG